MDQDGSRRAASSPAKNRIACVACRVVKMRCRPLSEGTAACERCTRKSFDCVYRQQKRGRKPGVRVSKSNQDASVPTGRALQAPLHSSGNNDTEPCQTTESQKSHTVEAGEKAGNVQSGIWKLAESLQPPNLLSHQPTNGWFPDQSALNPRPCASVGDPEDSCPEFCKGDPINSGLINYHVATSLFYGFMRNLNPIVCVLDPALYTFNHVRQRSSFLLAVILAAAAKAFNPPAHGALRECAEELLLDSFRSGTKSVEAIQAILLFTYWKQADDTRSWTSIGYAIRLAMELGWHKLARRLPDSAGELSEHEARTKRNVERTWLVLFIHDRGSSLQSGKPWMIEKSEFIESVNAWQKDIYATTNDATLCALATLRLTTADIIEVLNPQRPSPPLSSPNRINPLLRILKPQLDAWLKHWSRAVGQEPCHKFLVNFYVHHVQLFLYSFPLQESLAAPVGGPLIDNNAFWIAYTSALEMLKSIAHPTMPPLLSFIHDAVHVMIAYAAVFLIKLLLSVHLGIRQEIEQPVIENIKATARILAAQEMPPTYSCAMQARFLGNLIRDYEQTRHRNASAVARVHTEHPTSVSATGSRERLISGAPTTNVLADGAGSPPARRPSPIGAQAAAQLLECSSDYSSGPMMETQSDDPPDIREAGPTEFSTSSWILDHDECWTTMLMNAGFDVEEGVFLPDQGAIA